jgi:large subunit ribosomal protein L25
VKAQADDLPDNLDIDISNLDVGDSIKIEELEYDKLKFLDSRSSMIVSVISSRAAMAAMALPEDEEEEETEEAGEEGETSEAAEASETAETSEQ